MTSLGVQDEIVTESDEPVRSARKWFRALTWIVLALFLYCCLMIVLSSVVVDGPIAVAQVMIPLKWGLAVGSVGLVPLFAIRVRRASVVPGISFRLGTGLVVLALGAVVGVGVWRGVVVPWAPVAAQADEACKALEEAGLSDIRPDLDRSRTRNDVDDTRSGVFSYCGWTLGSPTATVESEELPFRLLNSRVWLYDDDPIPSVRDGFRSQRRSATRPRNLAGVGDEAFTDSAEWATVTARRANVMIEVQVFPATPEAAKLAEGLLRRMVSGVHAS